MKLKTPVTGKASGEVILLLAQNDCSLCTTKTEQLEPQLNACRAKVLHLYHVFASGMYATISQHTSLHCRRLHEYVGRWQAQVSLQPSELSATLGTSALVLQRISSEEASQAVVHFVLEVEQKYPPFTFRHPAPALLA
jgi:hypothetical protein